jgi:hypothetical protein
MQKTVLGAPAKSRLGEISTRQREAGCRSPGRHSDSSAARSTAAASQSALASPGRPVRTCRSAAPSGSASPLQCRNTRFISLTNSRGHIDRASGDDFCPPGMGVGQEPQDLQDVGPCSYRCSWLAVCTPTPKNHRAAVQKKGETKPCNTMFKYGGMVAATMPRSDSEMAAR